MTNIAREIQVLPIDQIKPYAKNARKHPPDQIAALRASIRRYGIPKPFLVDADHVLITGHGTLTAALAEGIDEAPVIVAAWLTPDQVKAFRIADNQLAGLSQWDFEVLRFELGELSSVDFDLQDGLGFDAASLGEIGMPGFEPEPEAPPIPRVSLAASFGVVPFSVLNAREGWWQGRKQAWLALGIQSEIGRGGNLIERSLQDRLAVILGEHYSKVVKFVDDRRAKGMTDNEIEADALKLKGKSGVSGSQRLSAKGEGGLVNRMLKGEGTKRATAHGEG